MSIFKDLYFAGGPWLDARGRQVSARLIAPFGARMRLARVLVQLEELRHEVIGADAMIPALGEEGFLRVNAAFRDLMHAIGDWMPAVECQCSSGCEMCGGKRWLTTVDMQAALERLQAMSQRSASLASSNPTASLDSAKPQDNLSLAGLSESMELASIP